MCIKLSLLNYFFPTFHTLIALDTSVSKGVCSKVILMTDFFFFFLTFLALVVLYCSVCKGASMNSTLMAENFQTYSVLIDLHSFLF